MTKAETTKTIEAKKLNKRTMRPVTNDPHTIPFGAILDQITQKGDSIQFQYLGEPYETPQNVFQYAVRAIE
jgi:hypothetical protein